MSMFGFVQPAPLPGLAGESRTWSGDHQPSGSFQSCCSHHATLSTPPEECIGAFFLK